MRAYTADWRHFSAWCRERSIQAIPAEPALVGEYLAELGEGYARATLRRKVAAIARANRMAGAALDPIALALGIRFGVRDQQLEVASFPAYVRNFDCA